MARQRLGQHFLADEQWREQIARAIRVSPHSLAPRATGGELNACWIEIGAGHGEMTEDLVVSGLPVIAVELDPMLAGALKKLAKKWPNLTVLHADVLETDLAVVAAGRRIQLYGNLPYYITSPILQHFFLFAGFIDEIHLVIQKEVAERLCASPGSKDYGYLSVLTQLYARAEFVFEIPPEAFQPPPEVDSALVSLHLPGKKTEIAAGETEEFLEFVKLCFAQKRKTLANNLRALAKPAEVREVLRSLQLREDARAEQLTLEEFEALRKAISSES